MKISYEWLSEYVDLEGVTPEQIAEELTRGGIEVDIVEQRDAGVENVVVGYVMEAKQHPNADKLRVCQVDAGREEPLQIVCGAPNVARGQKVPVALHGAKLPGGVKIKNTKLRGEKSQGMICSAKELGLPEKLLPTEQTEGILVLPEEAEVGSDVRPLLGLTDTVLELDLTPNRSDCLSMWGTAYEVAALLDREIWLPEAPAAHPSGKTKTVAIELDAEEDCPFYAAQVVDNLKLAPSPQWLQNRLVAAGIRPINNVVDVTNYVMLEYGQPLHAFDYDKVTDGEIVVRRAQPGEQVKTLDGVTRACDGETLLITDGTQPIGIAGVMGGENSEVTESTTTVLLESAFFAPPSIRSTARKLGLRSEASNRFEKGVDPERIVPALQRAVQLLQELAGGEPASEVTVEKMGDVEDVTVQLRHDRLNNVLGVQVKPETVRDVFRRLRFEMEERDGVYRVRVPSRRPDISIEVDLIEEVARIYGYDKIPTTLPWGQQSPGALTREQKLRRVVRHTLRDAGFNEVLNYSLTSPDRLKELPPLDKGIRPVRLNMPMSDERKVLRTTLLPQLVESAEYNVHRRQEQLAFFELGRTYITEEKKLTELPQERWELAALVTGPLAAAHWQGNNQPVDFFTVKGQLEMLLTRLGVQGIAYRAAELEGFHPGRTAEVLLNGRVIGCIGQIHLQVSEAHDLEETYAFQVQLAPLFEAAVTDPKYAPIPRYPSTTRDLALVVHQDVPAAELESAIRQAGGKLLVDATLFDVFTGKQVGEGKKSVAYTLTYRAEDRTLTDEEVNEVHGRIVEHVEAAFRAVLRQ
ncbi:phenylalanine--tRNA ligase beta subunit [Marinithermofilum abyssi]|uniref:Phenylalanine--tRNA ligase beta subunit n=1 Tax=Marinithermofilum abyssi TaxID=1571185 RepID=A0A8J2VC01_9BACL|nr:phenylalanine--tRNA ligase subunit beta [Marinithermofilum abyssi]GGE17811.1 phenylalanine--tRNA ligase beta subunit [Marinithermofilum abyssi]